MHSGHQRKSGWRHGQGSFPHNEVGRNRLHGLTINGGVKPVMNFIVNTIRIQKNASSNVLKCYGIIIGKQFGIFEMCLFKINVCEPNNYTAKIENSSLND